MPDLPFLTQTALSTLIEKTSNNDVLIVPSITGENEYTGTSMLYLRSPSLLSFEFGVDSHVKFQKTAQEKKLIHQLLNFDPFARDIDTIGDLKYLKDRIESSNNPEKYHDLVQKIF